MASFSDQVKVLIDVDSTGATSGITSFRKSFDEAEGAVGKFKVASGAAFDLVKANAGKMAAAAGAAITAFAIKGANDFVDLALAASKFSDATGLAVEDASRYLEVSDDIGVSSETIQKAFNKLNVAISAQKKEFKELGVEVAYNKDGLVDVNETFLRTIDALKYTTNATDRARLGTAVLGKSWTDLAELVQMGAGGLKTALAAVSDAKVINPDEVKKAKEFRAAMDQLMDAFQVLAINLGTLLVPAMNLFNSTAGKVLQGVANVFGGTSDLDKKVAELAQTAKDEAVSALILLQGAFYTNTVRAGELRYRALQLGSALNILDDDTNGLVDSFDRLLGRLSKEQEWDNLKTQVEGYRTSLKEAFEKATPQAAAKARDEFASVVRAIGDIMAANKVASQDQLRITASLEKGDVDLALAELKKALDKLSSKPVVVEIVGKVRGVPIPRGQTPSETSGRGLRSTMDVKGISTLPENAGQAVNALDKDTNDLIDSWDTLLEQLDTRDAWDNVGDQIGQYKRDLADAFKKKTPEAARAAVDSSRDVIRAFADIAQQAKLTNEQQIALKAMIDKGEFDAAYASLTQMIDQLQKTVVITVKPADQTVGSTAGALVPTIPGAIGTIGQIEGGTGAIDIRNRPIGSFGPKLNRDSLSLGNTNVVVNVAGSVVSENDLVEQVRQGLINAQKSGKQLVYSNT